MVTSSGGLRARLRIIAFGRRYEYMSIRHQSTADEIETSRRATTNGHRGNESKSLKFPQTLLLNNNHLLARCPNFAASDITGQFTARSYPKNCNTICWHRKAVPIPAPVGA